MSLKSRYRCNPANSDLATRTPFGTKHKLLRPATTPDTAVGSGEPVHFRFPGRTGMMEDMFVADNASDTDVLYALRLALSLELTCQATDLLFLPTADHDALIAATCAHLPDRVLAVFKEHGRRSAPLLSVAQEVTQIGHDTTPAVLDATTPQARQQVQGHIADRLNDIGDRLLQETLPPNARMWIRGDS